MPEKTRLLIYNPCHEQWDNMAYDAEGRFCGSCQKTVVDLTMMSDQELLAWFASGRKNVCGRATEDQLNRDIVPVRAPKKKVWMVWWQFLLAGMLVSSEASAQVKPPKPMVSQNHNGASRVPFVLGYMAVLLPDQVIRIIDSTTKKPVPGASVQVDDDPKFFVADSVGKVVIPHRQIARASALKVSSIGYTRAVIPVDEDWRGAGKFVQLTAQPMELQPATVVANGGVMTHRVGAMVAGVRIRRSWAEAIKDTLLCRKSPLTVYPNPVAKGASVTLSLHMDKPGNYMAQLFTNGGAVVESMRLDGVDGPRTELMNIPGSLAAGVYFVRVFHMETGKMYTEKVMVL